MNQYMKRGDLTDRVLTWIQRHPSVTNIQISKGIGAKPGAVATITKRLHTKGKIHRFPTEKRKLNSELVRGAYRHYPINSVDE